MTLIEPEEGRTNDLVRSLIASQQESPFGIPAGMAVRRN